VVLIHAPASRKVRRTEVADDRAVQPLGNNSGLAELPGRASRLAEEAHGAWLVLVRSNISLAASA